MPGGDRPRWPDLPEARFNAGAVVIDSTVDGKTTWDGPGAGCGRALHLGCGLLDAERDEPYHDLGADWHSRRNDQAHTRRLIAQLEHLGHTVIINPAA